MKKWLWAMALLAAIGNQAWWIHHCKVINNRWSDRYDQAIVEDELQYKELEERTMQAEALLDWNTEMFRQCRPTHKGYQLCLWSTNAVASRW